MKKKDETSKKKQIAIYGIYKGITIRNLQKVQQKKALKFCIRY